MNFKPLKTFFFDNVGVKQTVFKNTFWLTTAEIITRLLQIILVIYITRILGATEYGKFSFALSFVSMFVVLSDFGLSDITTRELAKDKKGEEEYSDILSFKIILSVATLFVMAVGSFLITPDLVIRKVIIILSFFVLISNFFSIIYAFLRARQKMEYEAGAKIIQSLVTFFAVLYALFRFPSIENVSLGYLISNLIVLVIILLIFYFYIQPIKLGFSIEKYKKFFKYSYSLGLASIFGSVFVNVDSVIMGYLGQNIENGWYGAAGRVINLTVIPSSLILMSFYPVLSKLFKESKEKLQKVWDFYMESMIVLAVPITIGGFILSSKIIDFVYGAGFSPAASAFQILIFTTGIGFIYSPYIMMLVVSDQQKRYLWINLIAALANIVANIILIPLYSFYGASVAKIISTVIIFILGIEYFRRFVSINVFNHNLVKILFISVMSSLIMFVAICLPIVYNLDIIIVIILGTIIYCVCLSGFYKFLFKLNHCKKAYE